MKRTLLFLLVAACSLMAQEAGNVIIQASPLRPGAMAFSTMGGPAAPIKGAPFTATITNESLQTLSDGTHITQSSSGSTARDSQGRTRQDAPLPSIGTLSATDAPHMVVIHDPVAGTSYTLNLTDKTAWKNPMPPPPPGGASVAGTAVATNTVFVRTDDGPPPPEAPLPPPPGAQVFIQKRLGPVDPSEMTTEDLGTQTMEGVSVTGTRTTQTIPVGKIGNDRPIVITTEVWTSPDLKTTVLSKRNDPRTGEQTFKLTNIQRSEPDPSLFAVPSDFKIMEGSARTVIYKTKQ